MCFYPGLVGCSLCWAEIQWYPPVAVSRHAQNHSGNLFRKMDRINDSENVLCVRLHQPFFFLCTVALLRFLLSKVRGKKVADTQEKQKEELVMLTHAAIMSQGSGALPASGHHSVMLTVLVWMREWRVTQVPPERPSTFTTSDLPKQSSKCPVGSHFSELTLSCRVKRVRAEWSGGKLSWVPQQLK